MMRVLGLAAIAAGLAAPALAQDGFQWGYQRYVDPGAGQTQLSLGYFIPETDAIQFAAACQPGPQGSLVEFEISAAIGSLREGAAVEIFFTGQGFSADFRAWSAASARKSGSSG